ncbi:MAG: tyrosine-type recombinase/integrase [Chthoniobacterales bacterium]|nr:tyrosine-type recombinase/integrase [Chthoniobacterales bacterium]
MKTPKGWRVNVPGALTGSGTRSRRFFASREEADGFAAKLRVQLIERGTSARILAPQKADAALRAFALLGEDAEPETLITAVREYVARHDRRLASVTFEDAFQQFADAQPRSSSYAQSLRQYRTRLSSLHGSMLCDINARDIESAMADFRPTVFNYGLRILGGLFNYGRKRDLCATNPIEKLDRKKLPPKEVEIYAPEQAAVLLNSAEAAILPWLAVCMFAGLRASEARQLVWGDIDFTENFIRVRAAVSKTRSPRAIPMEANLRQWLLPFRREDTAQIAPQGLNVLRSQLRAAHRTSEVPQIKHGPRHSYASYLLARDGSVDALLLNVGHTDATTTFRHYHRVATARAAKAFWSIRSALSLSGKVVLMTR